jgi:hypothetical protein
MSENTCPICKRELADPISRHHLIPLSQGGKGDDIVLMHRICHNKVHSIYNEKELRIYNTVEKIMENEDIQKFAKWVGKKPLDFYDGSIKAKK